MKAHDPSSDVFRRWFWGLLEVDPESGCWNWPRAVFSDGYGAIRVQGKQLKAHRLALELSGVDLIPGLVVMHACDNRRCCNPGHLSQATTQDNTADRVRKGRSRTLRGTLRSDARLNREEVVQMREKYASGLHNIPQLALEYGLARETVNRIIRGESYKDEGGPIQDAEGRLGSKISPADRRNIRERYRAGGVTQQQLAAEFGVTRRAIGKIVAI